MGSLIHITAVILIVFWAIGFFALGAGPAIHILLVIAAISILLQTVRVKRKYD